MVFHTTGISELEQGKTNLYNKILTIKKIGTPTINSSRLSIKLKINSYITSQWDSGERKETYIDISQFKFHNETTDDRNTHINVSDSKDIKVKFLEDENYIYLYCQNSSLLYGNKLFIDVIECIGDTLRVKFNKLAGYETIPSTLSEISFNILGGYTYKLNYGESDWRLKTKILQLKLPLTNKYTQFQLTVKSPTANDIIYQKCNIYISTQENKSAYNFLEGNGNIYIEETKDTNYKYVNIYTNIFSSGVPTYVTLNNCDNLKNEYIDIIINNKFEDIDVSTFKETTPFNKIYGKTLNNKNGYLALPNNIMFQWGEIYLDGTQNDITVTLPRQFANSIYSVQLSGYWSSDNNVTYVSHSHNNSSFKIHLNELKPITITYFVVGS